MKKEAYSIHDEEAKELYGDELGAALLVIKDLRGMLQLAQHEHGMVPAREVDKEINAATKLLKKYGMQEFG